MQAAVTSDAGLSNSKVYNVVTARGAWWIDQTNNCVHYNAGITAIENVPAEDVNYQFAFINYDGHYYLYAPAVKKFIQPQKYFVTGYSTPVTLATEDGKTKVKAENSNLTMNIGGSQWTWDTWTTYDDGNIVTIEEAGDFDATEAISILTTGATHFDPHKVYTIACERVGYWAASADHNSLSSTTAYSGATDAEKQFAFWYEDEKLYIYSVGAGKFLKADGTLASGVLGDPMDYRIIGTSGYDHMLFIPSSNFYFNAQNAGGYAINNWSTGDAGNRQKIEIVDDVDVYNAMNNIVNPSYLVTYVVKDEGGNTLFTSDPLSTTAGAKITTLPSEYQRTFYTYNTLDLTISATNTNAEYTATWVGPFEISDDYESAHWYDMAMRSTWYVTTDNPNGDGSYNSVNANAMGLVTDSYQWAFIGNPYDGFQILNKAAGNGKSFGWTDANQTNQGIPTVMDDGEGHHLWNIIASTNNTVPANSFCLNVPGTNLYINQYGGAGGSLKFWDSGNNVGDPGSAFTVFEIPDNFAEFTGAIEAVMTNEATGYFTLNAATKALWSNDYKTTCSYDKYVELQNAIDNDANWIWPTTGYYRVKSNLYNKYYMSYKEDSGIPKIQTIYDPAEAITNIVKLTALGNHKYKVSLGGLKASTPAQSVRVGLEETGADFTAIITSPGLVAFTTGGTYEALHCANSSSYYVVGWTYDAGASQWIVEDATLPTNISVTIGEAGYATLNAMWPVTIPSGVKAYTGVINGRMIDLTEVSGTIPAATPVILEGTAGTYTFNFTDDVAAIAENDLIGTYQQIAAPNGCYILQNHDGKVGFYQVDTDVATPNIPAFRAYLADPDATVKAFQFNFGGEDGISTISNADGQDVIYDLAGRRVSNTTKGIYIVNGKKVIVK